MKRSKHDYMEELSAYLDQETDDPAAVARRIEQDPLVARHYDQMAQVSERVKALPEPEPHPAFVTRVMAAVRDAGAVRTPWWRPVLMPAITALIVMVLVGASALVWRGGMYPDSGPTLVTGLSEVDSEALESDLEILVMQAPEAGDVALDLAGLDAGVEEEELLIALSEAGWLDLLAETVESQLELDQLILDLGEEDSEVFMQLLQENGQEERMT